MDAPITELSNEITAAIDLAGPGGELARHSTTFLLTRLPPPPQGIVRLLQQCDSQIFTGWRQHQVDTFFHLQILYLYFILYCSRSMIPSHCVLSLILPLLQALLSRCVNKLFARGYSPESWITCAF